MLVCMDAAAEKLGESLQASMPAATRRLINEQVLVAGAARYTSMCVDDEHGFEYQTLRCSQFAAYPLGICGRNKAGEFFWCPITQPNEMLGGTFEISINESSPPRRLVLAEHTNPSDDPDAWGMVTDGDDLRWHSQITVPSSSVDQPQILRVVVEGSTGCMKYGWSDPFVQATFA